MDKKTIVVNYVCKHSIRYVYCMVRALAENGCEILAVVSKHMPEIEEWRKLKDVTLYEVDGYTSVLNFPWRLLKFFFCDAYRLRKEIRKREITTSYVPILSYWSIFVDIVCGIKNLIFTMHDPIPHNTRNFIAVFTNWYLARRAGKIVILSHLFKDYVVGKFSKQGQDVIVIPHGIDTHKDVSPEKLVRYSPKKTNFLFQGQISRYKGLHVLLEAYGRLCEERDDVSLTIAGSGDITSYAGMLKSLKNCQVINRWLTESEVVGLYNNKNVVLILPYLTATQSGVVGEAMSAGTPIIATKTGGLVEQIKDGETGYLVPVGDVPALYERMLYVTKFPQELSKIRKNEIEVASKLCWYKLGQTLYQLI